jgi:hypothetical protein
MAQFQNVRTLAEKLVVTGNVVGPAEKKRDRKGRKFVQFSMGIGNGRFLMVNVYKGNFGDDARKDAMSLTKGQVVTVKVAPDRVKQVESNGQTVENNFTTCVYDIVPGKTPDEWTRTVEGHRAAEKRQAQGAFVGKAKKSKKNLL